ncbi:MAG: type IX secretion system membrane protein PorP/SprF [Bacteroidia bacterium]
MRTLAVIFFTIFCTSVKSQNLEHLQLANVNNAAHTLENGKQLEFESLTKYSPNYYQTIGEHFRAVQGFGFNYKTGNLTLALTGLYSFGNVGMETLPLVFTTNYSFEFKKVKLVFGGSIKENFGSDNSKYFDLAAGAKFHNNKLSLHLANAMVFNPRNFKLSEIYEDSLHTPFLVVSYQYRFQKKGWTFTPIVHLMGNNIFNYSVFSFQANHEKIDLQIFFSSKKEWSILVGRSIRRFDFRIGYERKLALYSPSIGGGYLENKHYISLMTGYSF